MFSMLPSVLTAKIQSYQSHSDFGVLRVKKAAWRDVGGMLACEQAILPAIDEKQHGGSHYAEKPQLLRSAFCILSGCRNCSAISGNARWNRGKYRTETSARKTSAALLHPRGISDPEKIYRGLRSQHTLLRVPNKIESTDLGATRQRYPWFHISSNVAKQARKVSEDSHRTFLICSSILENTFSGYCTAQVNPKCAFNLSLSVDMY